ncbi:MAG TPA: polyprenyl synthetase family protein [Anaerolineaceae bacterium]|nr:polyprenyl synthetase family protein [Anaerolineaceae bacterium]
MNKSALASFSTPVLDGLNAVEDLMHHQADGFHPDLIAALHHLLSSGGKRIRATLTLLSGRMLGAPEDFLLNLAGSIELLHTATLVHDDLIDGALLRRGIPTLNVKWSAGATILTGDFLFARSAKLAAETKSIPAMQLFARTLSVIVNGEINQLFSSRCLASRADYEKRIYAKTASMFETATASAALISNLPDAKVEDMRKFGYGLGMAFQIIDDILDFTGQQSTLGKPVGGDLRQGLVTLPALYFLETYPNHPEASNLVQGKCLEDEQVANLVNAIRQSQAIDQAYAEARQYVDQSMSVLSAYPKSEYCDALAELAEYIVARNF